jgi:mono/diheme cytochrome c family protein
MLRSKYAVFGIPFLLFICTAPALVAQTNSADTSEFFETRIRPILSNSCYGCHTNSALGGLRLDSREAMLKGGQRGVAVVPGDPENSLLIKAVTQVNPDLKMPAGAAKLKDAQIADLQAWVKAGAKWPPSAATPTVSSADPKSGKYVIASERRAFWSFQPLASPAVPAVQDAKWSKSAIDRFVLARLDKEGLKICSGAPRSI